MPLNYPFNAQLKTFEAGDEMIVNEFKLFIDNEFFPCVAAKAALNKEQIKFLVVDHLACPKDDLSILSFIYDFIDNYRQSTTTFHTACVIFKGPVPIDEQQFDQLLWMRLQSLSNIDAANYKYDERVNANPDSSDFSFSLKEEAFFVIGMNPGSTRQARRFKYPALVFNPHAQFEEMRVMNRYDKMKNIVRKRDIALSGSINPMLEDFGQSSEVHQYSGMQHDETWKCPYKFMQQS